MQQLAPTRTKAGVAAATWLEVHGKKDLWKLYAHDQAELVGSAEGDARKRDVKAMLKLSKTVADALGLRYRQSAPYVLHPSLRPDHTVTRGQVCPCSYPSRHAAAGAAATAYLGGLDPERLGQYEWTEAQIDYSRIYMAGHVTSDVTGGRAARRPGRRVLPGHPVLTDQLRRQGGQRLGRVVQRAPAARGAAPRRPGSACGSGGRRPCASADCRPGSRRR